MRLGQAIKEIRESKGMTQTELGNLTGHSQIFISAIEKGKKYPPLVMLNDLASIFEIPVPFLFWNAIEVEDIKKDKQELFEAIKSNVDALINSVR
jgi:transcriptional regulator with XRE-family HTH domain